MEHIKQPHPPPGSLVAKIIQRPGLVDEGSDRDHGDKWCNHFQTSFVPMPSYASLLIAGARFLNFQWCSLVSVDREGDVNLHLPVG